MAMASRTRGFQIRDMVDSTGSTGFDISLGRITTTRPSGPIHTRFGLASLEVALKSQISGRRVGLSPRTMCDGTPACTGLLASKTYYVKTSAAGVLKDRFGTKLAALNTKSTWKFTTYTPNTVDTKAPEVAYNGGVGYDADGTNGQTVTGYIYFTEQVQTNTGSFSLLDCGADVNFATDTGATGSKKAAAFANAKLELGAKWFATSASNLYTCTSDALSSGGRRLEVWC